MSTIKWKAKAEETSFVLTGFAIVSLVFIISTFQKNLGDVEHIILFFSLAFIFEVISAFIHHDFEKERAGYHGTVFQYGGILAILCGFLTYFDKVMPWSSGMYVIYIVGIIVFIGLTFREVNVWQRAAMTTDET
ncbi:hypothetical protein QVH35_06945 [Candidatus Nitrosotenuis chungbukensis]|uniref:hypothetical protein n=1 Tax=Candidatus Nitrosotenuis chungbukensis TaxID=1353246 RepID=UPI002671B349|nr:hypothetical protein [Candidatus Nitrosotenuis chungbukensis]WKT57172.1 hypothetical protein QVH35_06945 [Candidatus Nitrosotenuis chungbukensis]